MLVILFWITFRRIYFTCTWKNCIYVLFQLWKVEWSKSFVNAINVCFDFLWNFCCRFFFHIGLEYLFTIWTCLMLYKEYDYVVSMRLKFLASQSRRPEHFTVSWTWHPISSLLFLIICLMLHLYSLYLIKSVQTLFLVGSCSECASSSRKVNTGRSGPLLSNQPSWSLPLPTGSNFYCDLFLCSLSFIYCKEIQLLSDSISRKS